MCRSKEAWDHFVFVPNRRQRRRAGHGAFLESHGLQVRARRTAGAGAGAGGDAAAARRAPKLRRAAVSASRCGALVPVDSAGFAVAASMMAGSSAQEGAAAALLKLCMMPAPVAPPPLRPPSTPGMMAERLAERPLASENFPEGSFLDMLFPGFNTDTFIWRVSALQLTNYVASLMLGSVMGTPKLCSLYLLGASWGPAISSGAIWRLLLPMLLHANVLHIFFNIFFQLRIGFNMEKQFGRRKFCLLYLFCGFLGNLLSVVANPFKLAVGASTSGFGLLGVWAAEVLLTWELLGMNRTRLLSWLLFMVLSCVMMSTLSPSVDFMGHAGGALAGFLLAIILADMQEEHQPAWYGKAKTWAKNSTVILILICLLKAITLGPEGPVPSCGSLFNPRVLPF